MPSGKEGRQQKLLLVGVVVAVVALALPVVLNGTVMPAKNNSTVHAEYSWGPTYSFNIGFINGVAVPSANSLCNIFPYREPQQTNDVMSWNFFTPGGFYQTIPTGNYGSIQLSATLYLYAPGLYDDVQVALRGGYLGTDNAWHWPWSASVGTSTSATGGYTAPRWDFADSNGILLPYMPLAPYLGIYATVSTHDWFGTTLTCGQQDYFAIGPYYSTPIINPSPPSPPAGSHYNYGGYVSAMHQSSRWNDNSVIFPTSLWCGYNGIQNVGSNANLYVVCPGSVPGVPLSNYVYETFWLYVVIPSSVTTWPLYLTVVTQHQSGSNWITDSTAVNTFNSGYSGWLSWTYFINHQTVSLRYQVYLLPWHNGANQATNGFGAPTYYYVS